MNTITIKSGTSARITFTPKINGQPATSSQLSGVTIYVFFVHQFTRKVYNAPYQLNSGNLVINLTPSQTIEMLNGADDNQKFVLQFAVKDSSGNIIAEEKDSDIAINITRWEAGIWLMKD